MDPPSTRPVGRDRLLSLVHHISTRMTIPVRSQPSAPFAFVEVDLGQAAEASRIRGDDQLVPRFAVRWTGQCDG